MREIKFRAWDKVRRTFVYFYMKSGEQPMPLFDGNFLWNDLECWQQFTGLHDKNGKEIYEGDLVRTGYRLEESNAEEVFFEGGAWSVGRAYSSPLRDYLTHDWCEGECCPRIEVIGNIFETPELLTNTTTS